MFIDTHTHLWDERFNEDREIILSSLGKELKCIIEIGVDLKTSESSVSLSYKNKNVFSVVGVHPHDAKKMTEDDFNRIKEIAKMDKVVGIGEIGLDFYRNISPVEDQKKCFIRFLELAKDMNKPIVLHIRDAYSETMDILKKIGIPAAGGVVHSFLSDYHDAKQFIDMGLYLGIGGPLTFKKNEALRETVKKIPLQRMVSETDCPYLTPVPKRGKRNEPAYVEFVIEAISSAKNSSLLETQAILYKNAIDLFSLTDFQT